MVGVEDSIADRLGSPGQNGVMDSRCRVVTRSTGVDRCEPLMCQSGFSEKKKMVDSTMVVDIIKNWLMVSCRK